MKPIRLHTERDNSIATSKRELVRAARDCPEQFVLVYMAGGKIKVRTSFFRRLEVIGALEAAKKEVWDA